MAVNPRIAARTSLLRAGQFLLKTLWHATARKKDQPRPNQRIFHPENDGG